MPDINDSDKARLQPWYQPNALPIYVSYSGTLAPAAYSSRWSYTVPSSRIAILTSGEAQINRVTAANTPGEADCFIYDDTDSKTFVTSSLFTNVAGDWRLAILSGGGIVILAGKAVHGYTNDGSTNGTITFDVLAAFIEFDI